MAASIVRRRASAERRAILLDVAQVPRVLTIAGSDSGGGAGIQADLKAFARLGVYGTCAITVVTAQSTLGVASMHTVPVRTVTAQIEVVLADIGVDAVKIGMLGTVATVHAVVRSLDEIPRGTPVVLDPVMVAESGAELLDPAARAALVELLLPLSTVVTPNLPEARALVAVGGSRVASEADMATLARAIHALGPAVVVITGGHRAQATDLFCDGETVTELAGERYPDGAAHGSGCTHASVLAARLAWGDEPLQAARTAKALAARAVRDGLSEIGAGPGPVDVLGVRSQGRTS